MKRPEVEEVLRRTIILKDRWGHLVVGKMCDEDVQAMATAIMELAQRPEGETR